MISTKQVLDYIKTLKLSWQQCEKLVQELAWRDYWQQVWLAKADKIHQDLKNPQKPVENYELPRAIRDAKIGISVIDRAIVALYKTGYMHNHIRMYVAAICCNMAKSHWQNPAQWMYANLLDGDLASNNLSWQWVAGSFSNKKYLANQENINKYFADNQKNTFLDCSYEELAKMQKPEILQETILFNLQTPLPKFEKPKLEKNKKTLLYNYYNLDPNWHKEEDWQRILLLEPSVFAKYPINQNCINFVLDLAKNIEGIQIFVGEISELTTQISIKNIIYKEHPLNKNYQGLEKPRDWMSSISGYYPSFFAFWKKAKKEIEW